MPNRYFLGKFPEPPGPQPPFTCKQAAKSRHTAFTKKCTARAVEGHSTEISDPLQRAKDILDMHTLQPLTIRPEAASRRFRPATVCAPMSHMHASTPACKTQRPHALRPHTPKSHVRSNDERHPHVLGDLASCAAMSPPLRPTRVVLNPSPHIRGSAPPDGAKPAWSASGIAKACVPLMTT